MNTLFSSHPLDCSFVGHLSIYSGQKMSSNRSWNVQKCRGNRTAALVDYVVMAEFDIDTGSTVKHQYPDVIPDYKADWFAEHMLPEGAHNRVIDYTYIFLNRDCRHLDTYQWIKPESESLSAASTPTGDKKYFLYGLNLVKTRHDSTVRRGAIVKSMCIFSKYSFVEAFKRPLENALDEYFDNQSISVLQALFENLNSVDVSGFPFPSTLEQLLMRRGVTHDNLRPLSLEHNPRSWIQSFEVPSSKGALTLQYPTYQTPDEVGEISLTRLLKIFGESTMKIYHGLLMKQRILFVGYGHAAQDIAQIVLSAVAMVAPPMSGIIRRTFPYANLTDLTFLEVKGYVAGVTNPMFQQRENWWDILCTLDLPNNTGTVYALEDRKNNDAMLHSPSSSNLTAAAASSTASADATSEISVSKPSGEENTHHAVDTRFVQGVLSGISMQLSEEWVRQQFLDYTTQILTFIQDKNMLLNMSRLDDKIKRWAEANLQRFSAIEATAEFRDLPRHPWVWDRQASEASAASSLIGTEVFNNPIRCSPARSSNSKSLREENTISAIPPPPSMAIPTTTSSSSIASLLDSSSMLFNPISLKTKLLRLRLDQNITFTREMESHFLMAEQYLRSETALQGLVILFPESQGGLTPFAAGMFHTSPIIRYCTLVLLDRVQSFASTKPAFDSMNTFLVAGYKRLKSKWEDGSLAAELQKREEKIATGDGSITPPPQPIASYDSHSTSGENLGGNIVQFLSQTLTMLNADNSDEDDGGDEKSGPQIELEGIH